ncbi:hypothetical protein ACJMK2_016004, partial [Sinanodonta woodiana]
TMTYNDVFCFTSELKNVSDSENFNNIEKPINDVHNRDNFITNPRETDIKSDKLIINQDNPIEDKCPIESNQTNPSKIDIKSDKLIINQDNPIEDKSSFESNQTNPRETDIKSDKLTINQDNPIEDKCPIESNQTNPRETDIKSDKLTINQDNPNNDNEDDYLSFYFERDYQPEPVVKKIRNNYEPYTAIYGVSEGGYDPKDFKRRSYEEDPDCNFYRPVDHDQLCEYYDRNLGNPIFTRKKETV